MREANFNAVCNKQLPILFLAFGTATAPASSIETLEKWTRALEIPLYASLYDGKRPAKPAVLPKAIQLLNSPGDVRFMDGTV